MSTSQTVQEASHIHRYYADLRHGQDMVLRENVKIVKISDLSYQFLNGQHAPEPTNLIRPDVWQEKAPQAKSHTALTPASTAQKFRLHMQPTPVQKSRMPRYQLRNIFGETYFRGWSVPTMRPGANDTKQLKAKRRAYGYEAFETPAI